MRNIIKNIKTKVNQKITSVCVNTRLAVANNRGEGAIGSAISIITAVVIGGLLLAGLYTLFNTSIIPTMTSKITAMFDYTGT